jgi:chromosome segregation ATPase
VKWVASGHQHRQIPGPLSDTAALIRDQASALSRADRAEDALARAVQEVDEKRSQHASLSLQVHTLTDTVARQARALDEVAAFKREAIQLLGNEGDRARRTSDELSRENALLRADIEKKSAELRAMDDLRARLENDLTNLRGELERLRDSGGWLRRR